MSPTESHIRQLAAAQGIATLSGLARVAQVDRATVFRAVRGARAPRAKSMKKIARALGVSVSMLAEIFAGAKKEHAA